MTEQAPIIKATRISAGITPAMNIPPTDTVGPAINAYTIIAPEGGMIGPRFAAAATTADENPTPYTLRSDGISVLPSALASATAAPETVDSPSPASIVTC